jgi:osmotically inducible protein OsmC
MTNKAVAVWNMSTTPSKGTLRTGSRAIADIAYLAPAVAKRRRATTSIELMAAALATCYSITLAAELERLGLRTRKSITTSTLTAEITTYGWTISNAHLKVLATVPRAKPGDFISASIRAKLTCPVCRLLNVEIAMDARLQS